MLQKFIKKFYIYDRFLRRKYDAYVDFYVKFGHYRGFCLQNGLPVRGQRTKSNGSTSNKLNRKRVSPAFLTVPVFKADNRSVSKKKSKK